MRKEAERAARPSPEGAHLCLVGGDPSEDAPLVGSFLADGIASRERCLYLAKEALPRQVAEALRRAGIDGDRAARRGDLVVTTPEDPGVPWEYDEGAMICRVQQAMVEALRAGYHGLRIVRDMEGLLQTGVRWDALLSYEGLINLFLPGSRVRILCQYSPRAFPPYFLDQVLRLHPMVALEGIWQSNLHYQEGVGGHNSQGVGRTVPPVAATESGPSLADLVDNA